MMMHLISCQKFGVDKNNAENMEARAFIKKTLNISDMYDRVTEPELWGPPFDGD